MFRTLSLGLSLLSLVADVKAQGGPSADMIVNLPGLTWSTHYNMYSGYLSLSNHHNLHYWFVESQGNPATDPVTLWMNGGPGCSSLDGLLYEHGPIHVTDSGTLYNNSYAWNLHSNVIYLEAPIGVGFSYSSDGVYNMNDNTTADDNYHALLVWFGKFPNYVGRDFYVTGESYGGVYVPSLVLRILQGNAANEGVNINLKAFAVGNGLSSYADNDDSTVWFAMHHGIISEQLWNSLLENCCTTPYTRQNCPFNSDKPACAADYAVVMDAIYDSGLNWYNIYGDCLNTPQAFSHKKYIREISMLHQDFHRRTNNRYLTKLKENVECIDSTGADIYLNNMTVRQAIHIPSTLTVEWSICSDILNYTTLYQTMAPTYKSIFSMDSQIYAYVYNGDTDLACNFLGDEWFVDDLQGIDGVDNYRKWMLNNQIAGWTKDYPRISFVTVRGSGHMVPQWRPPQALKMFKYFLAHQPLD